MEKENEIYWLCLFCNRVLTESQRQEEMFEQSFLGKCTCQFRTTGRLVKYVQISREQYTLFRKLKRFGKI